jgi:hypothetical protein
VAVPGGCGYEREGCRGCRVRSAIHVAASTIRPTCLQDSNVALTFHDRGRAHSGTQLSVFAGGVYIGSITKTMRSIMTKDAERWDWALQPYYGRVTRGSQSRYRAELGDVVRCGAARMGW